MEKIIIVTGDNLNLVTNVLKELKNEADREANRELISFPEERKHISTWSSVLRETLGKESDKTYIITTFHGDVINLMGIFIEEKILNNEDIRVIYETKDKRYNAIFTSEGYLHGHPIGYFLPCDFSQEQ